MIGRNLLLVLMAVVLAALNASSPYFIGRAVDSAGAGNSDFMLMLMVACLTILIAPALKFVANVYIGHLAKATRLKLKSTLVPIYLRRLGEFDGGGQVISLVEGDVGGALYLYHRFYFDLALNAGSIVLSLIVIALMNPLLTIPPLVSISVGVLLCWSLQRSTNKTYEEYVNKDTVLLGRVCDAVVGGATVIKSDDPSVREVRRAAFRAHFRSASANALSSSCYFVSIMLLFYIGSLLLADNKMTIGGLLATLIYTDRVMSPASALMAIYYATREASVRLARIKRMSETDG